MPSFMCMPWSCNRQVDSLDRRQCNLQQIPGDIERYARSLEELLLDMNHIRDLPKSLFRLHKLQRLGLSDNDIHRLPSEVSALQNLVELNLSRNDISDLPEDLRICQNLQVLDISSNPIARLPDSITLCISLTQLSLNDISLTKLPQDIGKLVLLRSLEVRENHLRALPPSIAELSQLQRLDLGQNELDELPNELGSLRALQELYADENSLERLPDAILHCTRLEQLDISSNRLFQLPEELGELVCLADLTVSHNCLRELPNSIGRMKRLLILKADDNAIDSLTPAIGGCTALNELYLQQNLIAEVPSSIGNLRWLQTLNLDRCQLHRLPALIGECQSLAVLSLRDNLLEELPMEVGKLAKLRVLDICNNKIAHLPYTVNVLRELQALWLSENQSQALLRLQQEADPRTGIKVLTCYLLPQQSAETKSNGNGGSGKAAGFVGGPKVHFGGEEEPQEEAGTAAAAGTSGGSEGKAQFERKNTPHPKPSVGTASGGGGGAKHHKTKQQVDGHVMPRMDEHPTQIALNSTAAKKISQDHSSQHSHTTEPSSSTATAHAMPRSALKYSSRAVIQQQKGGGGGQNELPAGAAGTSASSTPNQRQQTKQSAEQQQQKTVFFANFSSGKANSGAEAADSPVECRLKRVNTPHYKSQRAGGGKAASVPSTSAGGQPSRRQLPKTPSGEQMGGIGTANQPSTSPRPSMASAGSGHGTQFPLTDGMRVKEAPQQAGQPASVSATSNPSSRNCNIGQGGPGPESPLESMQMEGGRRQRLVVRREAQTGLGLSIAGGIESTPFMENDPSLFISKLVPGGAAERAGLRVGDKVLEINGTSMAGRKHQVAVDCIQQRPDGVELVILRQTRGQGDAHRAVQAVQPTPSSSVTSLHQIVPANGPAPAKVLMPPNSMPSGSIPNSNHPNTPNTSFGSLPALANAQKLPYAADLPFGDPQLDGVVEQVDLVRDSKNSLGLSIVGGIDHCSHPFGSSTHPGVFISKITTNSPAEMSRRLRIGDRILRVNEADIAAAKHNEAVEALKSTGRTLRLTVCHEPQPKGLRSFVVHRREHQQALGLSICGGIGSSPVNPDDPTDEGIFIERVERGGPAEQSCAGLGVGMRVLEVNDDSLLGCTKEEAAQIFRRASAGPVRLLICDGFSLAASSTASRPPMASVTVSASSPVAQNKPGAGQQGQQAQNGQNPSASPLPSAVGVGLLNSPPPPLNGTGTGKSPEYQNIGSLNSGAEEGGKGKLNGGIGTSEGGTGGLGRVEKELAGSVPLLLNRTGSMERGSVTTFSSNVPQQSKNGKQFSNGAEEGGNGNAAKIPPPVAPKPKLNITSFSAQGDQKGREKEEGVQQQQQNNELNSSNTSATNFSARLRQFQQGPELPGQQQQMPMPMPPSKRPLLSSEDLVKLAEDDRMRQLKRGEGRDGSNGEGTFPEGISPISPMADRPNHPSFEHLLNDSPIPLGQPMSSIRTKKAENRFLQQQQLNSSPSTAVDQLATEQQRRSEWRQARMASLEAESRRVGQLISDVNEISKLSLVEERQKTQAGGEEGK